MENIRISRQKRWTHAISSEWLKLWQRQWTGIYNVVGGVHRLRRSTVKLVRVWGKWSKVKSCHTSMRPDRNNVVGEWYEPFLYPGWVSDRCHGSEIFDELLSFHHRRQCCCWWSRCLLNLVLSDSILFIALLNISSVPLVQSRSI